MRHPLEVRDPLWPQLRHPVEFVRRRTLCKLGVHCRADKRERKFDGGKLPELCCYCRLIVGHWSPDIRLRCPECMQSNDPGRGVKKVPHLATCTIGIRSAQLLKGRR